MQLNLFFLILYNVYYATCNSLQEKMSQLRLDTY